MQSMPIEFDSSIHAYEFDSSIFLISADHHGMGRAVLIPQPWTGGDVHETSRTCNIELVEFSRLPKERNLLDLGCLLATLVGLDKDAQHRH